MKPLSIITLLAIITALSATTLMAQGQPKNGPPTGAMAALLGVSEDALSSCMPRTEGKPSGERPSKEQHEARLAEISNCLNAGGAMVSAEELGAAMEQFRPGPPPKG